MKYEPSAIGFSNRNRCIQVLSLSLICLLVSGFALAADYQEIRVIEKTERRIVIEWQDADGSNRRGVWDREQNTPLFRRSSLGCGWPTQCEHDSLIVRENDYDNCFYVSLEQNATEDISRATPFKTKANDRCNIYSFPHPYRIEDIAGTFLFYQTRVKPLGSRFQLLKNFEYYQVDISESGRKILASLYRDAETPGKKFIVYLDLQKRIARQIIFPLAESVEAGFIGPDHFVVKINYSYENRKIVGQFRDGDFGLLYRFDANLQGEPVEISNKSDRGVCQGDLKRFDVSRKGITLAGNSSGVCGHIDFEVAGRWQADGNLKVIYREGLGQASTGPSIALKNIDLFNYGVRSCAGSYGSGRCNSNEAFYQVNASEEGIKVSAQKYEGIAVGESIPAKGYLFPVWQKQYSGAQDIEAQMSAYRNDDTLYLQIDVSDDHLVLSNPEMLNNDHVEIWLFTQPTQFESDGRTHPVYRHEGWIGQAHFLLRQDGVELLDLQQYQKVAVDRGVFTPLLGAIEVAFNKTENGYRQKIGIPLNQLPFYQLRENSQCLSLMVDVVDVDQDGKQETLLSSNISRKWGKRYGAREICFDFAGDFTESRFMNDKNLAMDKTRYDRAILLNRNGSLEPYQFNATSQKLEPFITASRINYNRMALVELPQTEKEKIIHRSAGANCEIDKVYYAAERDKLVLLTHCPGSTSSAHVSLIQSGDTPKFLTEHKNYFTSCYRSCEGTEDKDYSNLEYGILDNDIHLLQVGEAAFYFSESLNTGGRYGRVKGLTSLASRITIDLPASSAHPEPKRHRDRSIFVIKQPLVYKGKKLNFSSRIYRSPLADFESLDPRDITCVETAMIQRFIDEGSLARSETIPNDCVLKWFDQTRIQLPVRQMSVLAEGLPVRNNPDIKYVEVLEIDHSWEANQQIDIQGFSGLKRLIIPRGAKRGIQFENVPPTLEDFDGAEIDIVPAAPGLKRLSIAKFHEYVAYDLQQLESLIVTQCTDFWPALPKLTRLSYSCETDAKRFQTLPISPLQELDVTAAMTSELAASIAAITTLKKLNLVAHYRSGDFDLDAFRDNQDLIEELELSFPKSAHVHHLSVLPYFRRLKYLRLEVASLNNINPYLELLEDSPLESFSLRSSSRSEDALLRLPFHDSIKKLELQTKATVAEADLDFPEVAELDIRNAASAFAGKDLGQLFPNLEKLRTGALDGAFEKVPASLTTVESSVVRRGSRDPVDLSAFGHLEVLKLDAEGPWINPYLSKLPIPYISIRHNRRLVPYAGLERSLLTYLDQERVDKIMRDVLGSCNKEYGVKLEALNKAVKKLALQPRCLVDSLWQLDLH